MGTVLSYVFYWIAVIVCLVYLKYKEVSKCVCLLDVCSLYVQGRTTILGRESAAGARRRQARAVQGVESDESSKKGSVADESHAVEGGIGELPR